MNAIEMIDAAADFVAARWPTQPRVGIILGSGLGHFSAHISADERIAYCDIPHFPRTTALAHSGHLVCGRLGGVPVVAMEGRCHGYEGYSLAEITLPVRVMHRLGIEVLIVSNACGGMNPRYAQGDIMVIDDHINLMFGSPLVGRHVDAWGERFPDMSRPYDSALVERALEIARQENFAAHRGVYVGVKGPNLETRAEYRFFRAIGGDVVGMSTVPEVIVAAQLGLRVLGLATVTNVCLPDALGTATGNGIVAVAETAEPKLRKIVCSIVSDFAATSDSCVNGAVAQTV